MRVRKGPRREEGASLVEFALVLPIFAMLLFGLIDFGLIFGGFVTLRSGTNAGARVAALDSYDSSCGTPSTPDQFYDAMICTIKDRIGSLPGTVPNTLKVTIALPDGSGSDGTGVGQPVEICTEADVQSSTGFFNLLMTNKAIHATSELRIEKTIGYASSAQVVSSC